MRNIISILSGALFGLGLVVSGMTDTTKVQGFLDLLGQWDPTLIFVMGGALVPMFFAWRYAGRHTSSLIGTPLPLPARTEIDHALIVGALMFGMGWALSGLCPGPAIASLSFGGIGGLVFMAAMLAGMIGYGRLAK
jgi:uncharacterized membrane protein YedE/YeeE